MSSAHSTVVASPVAASGAPEVWDHLWREAPSDAKDDALLAREYRSPRWALVVDRLQAAFGSIRGLRTIELGSGRGDISTLLAERGAEVTLFDQSEAALEQAKWRFDRLGLAAHCERGDMLDGLGPWRGRFDVALSLGVVEHFREDDRTRVIRAHYEVLRHGGMAVISVPNALCLPYRLWKSYLEFRGWWPYGMELPYCKRELIRRATDAGFADPEAVCMGFWQSVGDLWCKTLFGRCPDWVGRRSLLDHKMGFVLVLFGRREEAPANAGKRGGGD